jgi:hypothetical protein
MATVRLLAARYGILLGKAEGRVSIGEASLEVGEALETPLGSPVCCWTVSSSLWTGAVEWRMGCAKTLDLSVSASPQLR